MPNVCISLDLNLILTLTNSCAFSVVASTLENSLPEAIRKALHAGIILQNEQNRAVQENILVEGKAVV